MSDAEAEAEAEAVNVQRVRENSEKMCECLDAPAGGSAYGVAYIELALRNCPPTFLVFAPLTMMPRMLKNN